MDGLIVIGIDLSKQTNTSIPQQINSVGKLTKDDVQQCFLLLKSSKNYSELFFTCINWNQII